MPPKDNKPKSPKITFQSIKPPKVPLKRSSANKSSWVDIRKVALNVRGLIVKHAFKYGDTPTKTIGNLLTQHAHKDSSTHSKNNRFIKHNILSSIPGKKARAFGDMMPVNRKKVSFASNVMRVIKGTLNTKGIDGDLNDAQRAIELGSTIHVSEWNRGGDVAVLNAMTNLYRMKRGPLTASQWPKTYKGAGKGGAKRLRELTFDGATHEEAMKNIWTKYASKKPKWQGKDFADWRDHKVSKWTGKAAANFTRPGESDPLKSVERDDKGWLAIGKEALTRRGITLNQQFKLAGKKKLHDVATRHVHNDKDRQAVEKNDQHFFDTHNVLTSLGTSSNNSTLEDLMTGGGQNVAQNALRVLKGTQSTKGLRGSEQEARKAVELGAVIGVSETTRGGNLALLHAASNLYLVKHGKLTKDEWTNPSVGYKGAGDGGAERLRGMTHVSETMNFDKLREIYADKQKTKGEKRSFEVWLKHKATRWTSRQ